MRVVELTAVHGHALVAGVPLSGEVPEGRLWGLPDDLVVELQAWAQAVAAPADAAPAATSPASPTSPTSPTSPAAAAQAGAPRTDPTDDASVSRRGRHLAARLSGVLGAPVDYCDPVTGHRIALRGVTRTPHPPPVAVPAREPTPWATGLALAALTAALVLLANLALAAPMIDRLGRLGLVVDVVVAAGLVPALWLNRRAPTWRWAVYGTFVGMALAVPFLAVRAVSLAS